LSPVRPDDLCLWQGSIDESGKLVGRGGHHRADPNTLDNMKLALAARAPRSTRVKVTSTWQRGRPPEQVRKDTSRTQAASTLIQIGRFAIEDVDEIEAIA